MTLADGSWRREAFVCARERISFLFFSLSRCVCLPVCLCPQKEGVVAIQTAGYWLVLGGNLKSKGGSSDTPEVGFAGAPGLLSAMLKHIGDKAMEFEDNQE